MPTQSALELVDAHRSPDGDKLRAQAALVRALVAEVGRYGPSERRVVALHAQLGEELSRFAELLPAVTDHQDPVTTDRAVEVLIVEDDEPTLLATAMVIGSLGYPCRTAGSVEEALRCYEERPASLVVSDWNMPGQNGLDLCRALKRLDRHAYVILVTAFCDEEHLLEAVRAGIDDFLPKPVDVGELAERLRAGRQLVHAVEQLESVNARLRSQATTPGP
jgi:CheY-like chemotaxis protein